MDPVDECKGMCAADKDCVGFFYQQRVAADICGFFQVMDGQRMNQGHPNGQICVKDEKQYQKVTEGRCSMDETVWTIEECKAAIKAIWGTETDPDGEHIETVQSADYPSGCFKVSGVVHRKQ
jgi:hypothetical protein